MNVPFAALLSVQNDAVTAPFSFLDDSNKSTSVSFDHTSFAESSTPREASSFSFGAPTPASTPAQPMALEAAMGHRQRSLSLNPIPASKGSAVTTPPQDFPSLAKEPSSSSYGPSPTPSVWSSIAQRGFSAKTSFSAATTVVVASEEGGSNVKATTPESCSHGGGKGGSAGRQPKTVRIPQDLWNPSERRDSSVFHIPDPMRRYREVSSTHPRRDVLDLHFQSVRTFPVVLLRVLPDKLRECGGGEGVWIVTGSGHHVNRGHQKTGGVLEGAVLSWLDEHGYDYLRGKDRNGYCGAVLVKAKR